MTIQEAYKIGLEHQNNNRLADAEAMFRQILSFDPKHADTLCRLGILAQQVGRSDKALEFIARAVAAGPNNAEYLNAYGYCLHNVGRLDEAEENCRRALLFMPQYPEALNNLGNVLARKFQFEEAEAIYRKAVSIRPDFPAPYVNLGVMLIEIGRAPESLQLFNRALALGMNDPLTYIGIGNAWTDLKDFEKAEAAYRQALALRPDYPEGFNNLGNALWMQQRPPEALAAYAKAMELRPNYLFAQRNILRALRDLGRMNEALEGYRNVIAQHADSEILHSEYLFALHFEPESTPRQLLVEHQRWNEKHAKSWLANIPAHLNDRNPDRKLHIGYVSPDFREHSVAYFIESILANHDRDKFEIFCYADLHRPDDTSRRLQALVPHWRNLTGISDAQAADLVRRDRIDVLVDLAGHTANNRLRLFARKPAPVQITYMGYPNTTGLGAIDYRLTDAFADPPGQTEEFHTEKLLRLPECFLCFTPPKDSPDVSPPPARENGHITFGCFNALSKVNAPLVDLWCQILQRVQGSKLLLKGRGITDSHTRERLLELFNKHGVGQDRVVFKGFTESRREHLSLFAQIDIGLDTLPYNGTTVTCEALWMGVPVVTLAGQTHVTRVGVSLLNNVGFEKLVATSPEEYVAIAVAQAGDLDETAIMRAGLRKRMSESILTDGRRFTRQLESAYAQAWRSWCQR
jgi:predicted O-linked N-acetylglucosamine transferase (SPINDLY family)